MTSADALRLAKALKALGETFNEPVSDMRADAYLFALSEFSIDQVEQACRLAIQHHRFFPRPAELRDLIAGTDEDHALTAWQELVREVRRTGYTGWPVLPKPTRDAIERIWGSWQALCETLPAEGPGLSAWEKRFRETYHAVVSKDRLALPERPSRQLTE